MHPCIKTLINFSSLSGLWEWIFSSVSCASQRSLWKGINTWTFKHTKENRRLIITEAAIASYGSSGKSPQMKPCESSATFLCMLNSCSGISRLSPSVTTWHTYPFFAYLHHDNTQALQPARPKYMCLITTKRKKHKQMKDARRKPEQL